MGGAGAPLAGADRVAAPTGAPDDVERYFIFQTLVGAWPIEPERLRGVHGEGAAEAKRNSSWLEPNAEWERAVMDFCRRCYDTRVPFRARRVRRELAFAGDRVALGTVALKLTAPGVPDIYQGDEMPLRALVDPDNRRPVDWHWNRTMLGRLAGGATPEPEIRKLWLTTRLLGLRIRRPRAFAGAYAPLPAGDRTVAYQRGGEVVVAVATRPGLQTGSLDGIEGRWRDVLPARSGSWTNRAAVLELLDQVVAALERSDEAAGLRSVTGALNHYEDSVS